MRLSRVVRVLGQFEQVERVPRVAGGPLVILLRCGQPRLRPVEAGADDGVARIGGQLDDPGELLLGGVEVRLVDQRVREQDSEANGLDRVVAVLGRLERALEEADRSVELVDRRVGAAQRVAQLGWSASSTRPRCGPPRAGDRLTRLSFSIGELPEAGERAACSSLVVACSSASPYSLAASSRSSRRRLISASTRTAFSSCRSVPVAR